MSQETGRSLQHAHEGEDRAAHVADQPAGHAAGDPDAGEPGDRRERERRGDGQGDSPGRASVLASSERAPAYSCTGWAQ